MFEFYIRIFSVLLFLKDSSSKIICDPKALGSMGLMNFGGKCLTELVFNVYFEFFFGTTSI